MPAPFAILDIDHIVLRASDPARLEAFYRDVLGCPLELRQEAIRLTQLRAGRALIDIVPADAASVPQPGNVEHFCLRIEPFDPDTIRRHLAGHGIECGELKDRVGAEGRGPSLYFHDPDGNRVELKGPAR